MSDEPNLNAPEADAGEESTVTVDDTNSDVSVTAEASETESGEPDKADGDGSVSGAPDTYSDFTLPEGVESDAAAMQEASALFKELGLTQEQAQKLVDFQAKKIQEGSASQADTYSQLVNGWLDEAKGDKEYGGEHFDENAAIAAKAVNTFGSPKFKELLETYGIGNHPEMIRFAFNVGKTLKEDIPGSSSNPAANTEKSRVQIMYPNS